MAKTAVLINDTTADRHYGCERVVRTIEFLASKNGISIIARSPVHSDWKGDRKVLSAIDGADVVLVNGEGTIHHDRPAAQRLVEVANYCASLGKPAVLLNASWISNSAALCEGARRFAIVSARESESERQMRAAGIDCRRIADLAMHDEIMPVRRYNRIGVTDSVRGNIALDLDRLRRSCDGDIVNLFYGRSALSGLWFFLRHFGIRRASADPAAIAEVARAAWAFNRRQPQTARDLLEQIASLGLLITGRFHAAVFSLAALTPVLAVESNTPKISATLNDAGVNAWRVRPDAAFDAELLREAARWHGQEEDNVRDFLSDNRSRQSLLFRDISALAA